jgi:hypothetical protein
MYLKVMLTLLVVLEAAAATALWHAGRPEPGATYYTGREVAAGLNRRVGAVRLEGVPLRDAIERLAAAAGARVVIDADVARSVEPALDEPVDLELNDVPLSAAFDVLLMSWPLAASADAGGTVRVGHPAAGWDDCVVRAYDVGPILDRLAPGAGPPMRAEAAEFLARFIQWPDAPLWDDSPVVGSCYAAGDSVVVVHVEGVHRRVERVLAELEAAGLILDDR